jgi:hypothetical protein
VSFPYSDGSMSDRDIDAVHELVNDPLLLTYVNGLETTGHFTELAWLEQVIHDLDTQRLVCYAVAVARAEGKLEDLRLSPPSRSDDDGNQGEPDDVPRD